MRRAFYYLTAPLAKIYDRKKSSVRKWRALESGSEVSKLFQGQRGQRRRKGGTSAFGCLR